MSNHHRISLNDIHIGQPLAWDVMESSGRLLLRKGYVIETLKQAEALVERGIFIEQSLINSPRSTQPSQSKTESPSVLRTINLVVKRLGGVLRDIHKYPDAREKILEIAKMIHFSIRLNEDLALASILINQSSGPYSIRHCVDSAILATLVAQAMNKSAQELQDITCAALTMNISMLDLQEKLYHTKEAITAEEQAQIHRHPYAAIEILYDAGIEDPNWLMYVLMHHEHEDGTGYPVGTLKTEIPQNAKILSLSDGFCARISARSYRKSNLPNQALRDIFIENGARVDPMLGAYFIKVLSLYPPGTFVRLKNNEIALVSQRGSGPTASVAYSLVNATGEMIGTPIKRDTSENSFTITDALHSSQANVRINAQQIWGSLASL